MHRPHINCCHQALVGIDLQSDRWTSAGCGSTFGIQNDAIRNKVIDEYHDGGARESRFVGQVSTRIASISEADQVRRRVFVKMPKILIYAEPVENGQIAPLKVRSSQPACLS